MGFRYCPGISPGAGGIMHQLITDSGTLALTAENSLKENSILEGLPCLLLAHFNANQKLIIRQVGTIYKTRASFYKAEEKKVGHKKSHQRPPREAADNWL